MNELVTIKKLQQDEEYWFNSIIASEGSNLPAVISDILPIIAYTKAKVAVARILINSTKNIEAQKEIHQVHLESGQRCAQVALYSEAKLGDMLKETVKSAQERVRDGEIIPMAGKGGAVATDKSKTPTLGDIGISHKQSSDSQIIAKASKDGTLEEVFEKAKQDNDIPTKNAVINAMRRKQMEQKEAEYRNNKKPDPKPEINQELYKVSETIGGLEMRILRMRDHVEYLNIESVNKVIRSCKNIIDTLEGTVNG